MPFAVAVKDCSLVQSFIVWGSGFIVTPEDLVTLYMKSAEFTSNLILSPVMVAVKASSSLHPPVHDIMASSTLTCTL